MCPDHGVAAQRPAALKKQAPASSLRKAEGELLSENGGEGTPGGRQQLTKLRGGLREVRDPSTSAVLLSFPGPSA